jgi:hypothetical protein
VATIEFSALILVGCLFKQLPLVKEQDGYRSLLPQYIDPDLISAAPCS